MFGWSSDVAEALCVWVFTGPANTDLDYERYLRSIARVDEMGIGRDLPAGILVVDAGNPTPSAVWRKRIADATLELASKPLFAVVSSSMLVRGTITAINWLRPPPFEIGIHATFEAAVAWIEERRGRRISIANRLHAEARENVGKP